MQLQDKHCPHPSLLNRNPEAIGVPTPSSLLPFYLQSDLAKTEAPPTVPLFPQEEPSS